MKKSDWVTTKTGGDGIVTRVARNGKTADVRWRMGGEEWVKRMPTSALIVKSSIEREGMIISDMTAERDLARSAIESNEPHSTAGTAAESEVYGIDCPNNSCS